MGERRRKRGRRRKTGESVTAFERLVHCARRGCRCPHPHQKQNAQCAERRVHQRIQRVLHLHLRLHARLHCVCAGLKLWRSWPQPAGRGHHPQRRRSWPTLSVVTLAVLLARPLAHSVARSRAVLSVVRRQTTTTTHSERAAGLRCIAEAVLVLMLVLGPLRPPSLPPPLSPKRAVLAVDLQSIRHDGLRPDADVQPPAACVTGRHRRPRGSSPRSV